MRGTKIVATLGPATSTREKIAALVGAGMDVARLNFSHGSHAEHAERIAGVRQAAADAGRAVAILQDLQGPKIRTGELDDHQPVELVSGQRFALTSREVAGSAERVSTTYASLPREVKRGDRILLSDGLIELRVIEARGEEVQTEVVCGGVLKEHQGINLPGIALGASAMTEKDSEDLAFGLAQHVDCVALSFVRDADDVLRIKTQIARAGKSTPVIAKLERAEAIEQLSEILDLADGIMVARGDLGVELPPEKVPLAQKRIIREANRRRRPVITATQMLESMIERPRPTRAEASDVANAILDGSDAVMLSGETAVGRHPVGAVETMVRIAREIHAGRPRLRPEESAAERNPSVDSPAEAIGAAVAVAVRRLARVSAIWAVTESGATALMISQLRPAVPILAFTPNEGVYRWLALAWGVTPVLTPVARGERELEAHMRRFALERGLASVGDVVVMTGSHPFHRSAPTNFLKLERV